MQAHALVIVISIDLCNSSNYSAALYFSALRYIFIFAFDSNAETFAPA